MWNSRLLIITLAIITIIGTVVASAEETRRRRSSSGRSAVSRVELRANTMINNAVELLEAGQGERAEKILNSVPKMFPEVQARYRANIILGKHYMEKRKFEEAISEFNKAMKSEKIDEKADAMTQTGICYYRTNAFDKAFLALRRVTNEYPGTLMTNEAYYYIGQCHFERRSWSKAAEAFRMVGTSVSEKAEKQTLAEAGQRLFITVTDKDLMIQSKLGQHLEINIASKSDSETVSLSPLGRTDEDFIASVRSTTESSKKNDGTLTIRGGETVTASYVDRNTLSGERNTKRLATVKLVSTASVAFTDGAYKQTVNGVFGDQPVFVRIKDLDMDKTINADTLTVTVTSNFKVEKETSGEDKESSAGIDLSSNSDEVRWQERGKFQLTLTESGPTTGIFLGKFEPILSEFDQSQLPVMAGDKVSISYVDKLHLQGDDPQMRTAEATIVVGGSTEPQSIIAKSSDPNIEARKLLLEAQLFHKLGFLFKEVGLKDRAIEKGEEGLDKINKIMRLYSRNSLDRMIVEQSFAVKWELFIIQDQLPQAIATCRALLKIFPDSEMADRAFMNIGKAFMISEDPEEKNKAINVLTNVAGHKGSKYAAEAQYLIGQTREKMAESANGRRSKQSYAAMVLAYRKCAETFPDSHYAGESLKKVVGYYIAMKDYPRASQMIEQVFLDYPDAPWLDELLLKWGVVAFRMRNKSLAIEKFQQLIEEYPGGTSAKKAKDILNKLGA